MKKFSDLSLSQLTAMLIPAGKILVVDGTNGSDTKGLRGVGLRAFRTLTAAKAAASSGDTIIVMPGTYTENNLLKDGVNWHFMAGTKVSYVNPVVTGASTVYGIFDDRAAACACQITGDAIFTFDAGWNDGSLGTPIETVKAAIYVTNVASKVKISARAIQVRSYILNTDYVFAARLDDGELVIDCDEIIDTSFGVVVAALPSVACGIRYSWGKMAVETQLLKSSAYIIYSSQKVSPTGSGTFSVFARTAQGFSSDANAITITGGTTTEYRTFVKFEHGIPGGTDFYGLAGGGEHSFYCDRIVTASGTAVCNLSASGGNDPVSNIQVNSVTTGEYALIVGIVGGGSPKVFANFPSVQSTHSIARCAAGETVIVGGIWKTTASGATYGVSHEGGVTRIQGATINTAASVGASDYPVQASASGLIIDGCRLVAPAGSNSIGGTATVKVYGQTLANLAKAGTITVQVGTLTVDANVT
jgi:hypothetical protein